MRNFKITHNFKVGLIPKPNAVQLLLVSAIVTLTRSSALSTKIKATNSESHSDGLRQTSHSKELEMRGAFNQTCVAPELSDQVWERLSIDRFIQSFPLGVEISVKDFMNFYGAHNFLCGIGEHCNAGQLCSPIMSVEAWLVAFAIQQFNSYVNNCFDAIGYTVSTTSSVVSSMVVDMFEDFGVSKMRLGMKKIAEDSIFAAGSGLWLGLVIMNAVLGGITWSVAPLFPFVILSSVDAITPELRETDFKTWSQLSMTLSRILQDLQKGFEKSIQNILQSGIGTNAGIMSAIRGGFFLQENSTPSPAEIEQKMNYYLQAKIMTRIMRANNVYITRASDPCHFSGVAGARAGADIMSYCDSEGVLWDVVRAKGNGVQHKIHNANLISNRYGFSVETIIQSSWACQKKYSEFEHEMLNLSSFTGKANATALKDHFSSLYIPENKNITALNSNELKKMMSFDDCLFNLPVCDCALPAINLARAPKKHHTTKICRQIGKLPI